ncbi:hypothetical protein [Enterococcus sp. AZ102]|uniref:hypothetical protein n=1 Tax=unclassified Enterococcus TaxID=2608891 RepID=UPI003F21CE44
MKSKLVYLLLFTTCTLLFLSFLPKTYAYFNDTKTINSTLTLHKPTLKLNDLFVSLKTLNETKTVDIQLESQTTLTSDVYLGKESNPWSDYITLKFPKRLTVNQDRTKFTGQIEIKKIKELPENHPKELKITIPIFLDHTLSVPIATASINITNQEDELAQWPDETLFKGEPYYLTNTLYYVSDPNFILLNQPTLYLSSDIDSPLDQTTVDKLFAHKIKTNNGTYFNVSTSFVPKKGFKVTLLGVEKSTNDQPSQVHIEQTMYTKYMVIGSDKLSIRQFAFASDLAINNLAMKTDTTIQTNPDRTTLSFSSIVNNSSLTAANISDMNPDLSWALTNSHDFSLSIHTTNIAIQQLTTRSGNTGSLQLINTKTNQVLLTRALVSTQLDETLPTRFTQARLQKKYTIQKAGIETVELRTPSEISYKAPYYEVPLYFNISQNDPLNQSSSFSLQLDGEFSTVPIKESRSNNGTLLNFTLYFTPQQLQKEGFNFSLQRAATAKDDSRFIYSDYISLSSIRPKNTKSVRVEPVQETKQTETSTSSSKENETSPAQTEPTPSTTDAMTATSQVTSTQEETTSETIQTSLEIP